MEQNGSSSSSFAASDQGNRVKMTEHGKLVKLSEIHEDAYQPEINDFILVRVIWRSEVKPKTPCRFILADDTDHIMGYFFLDKNKAHNVNLYRRLKAENGVLKIEKVVIEERSHDRRMIRHQSKILKFSGSTIGVTVINADHELFKQATGMKFIEYLPFQFTPLQSVDHCPADKFVDIIGNVKEIYGVFNSKKNGHVQYQKIRFSTLCSSDIHSNSDNEYEMDITFFGDSIGTIENQDKIYALLNVKVNYFDYENSKSLKTTTRTVVKEISRENIKNTLPPSYQNQPIIQSLFPDESRSLSLKPKPLRRILPRKSDLVPVRISKLGISISTKRTQHRNENAGPIKKTKQEVLEQPSTSNNAEDENSDEGSGDEFPEKIYDFVNEVRPLNVCVKPALKLKGRKRTSYSMRSKQRGIALIINNYYFPKRDNNFIREGSNNDVVYLVKFLRFCNFLVTVKDNVQSKDLPSILLEFKREATKEMDACFVAVMSHGYLESVEMTDDKIIPLHSDIIYQFDDLNFPMFKGKPKIFVLQACQNLPLEEEMPAILESVMPSLDGGEIELDDTIVCYATIPETAAQRDIYLGSHFVYALVDTLMNHACDRHFVEIFHEVQSRLKKLKKGKKLPPINCAFRNFGFKKKLYFNPGL